ncbi:MAG TPA: hypothetical protein VMI75_01320, partial [Polyangiaceae bacterium]|nr:hypothetical protein [Polyangiaceae bacterium]
EVARQLGFTPLDTVMNVEAFHIHGEQQLFNVFGMGTETAVARFGFGGATSVMCPMCTALHQGQ